jgi:hypothetical protein
MYFIIWDEINMVILRQLRGQWSYRSPKSYLPIIKDYPYKYEFDPILWDQPTYIHVGTQFLQT